MFATVDVSSVRVTALSDASFAMITYLTLQLGKVVMLADASEHGNSLQNLSVKSKRVTRSVLTAESFAAVCIVEYAGTLKATLSKIFEPLVL